MDDVELHREDGKEHGLATPLNPTARASTPPLHQVHVDGLGTAISGSRPTMIVSLWWRVWLQRQKVDSRMTMYEAIS